MIKNYPALKIFAPIIFVLSRFKQSVKKVQLLSFLLFLVFSFKGNAQCAITEITVNASDLTCGVAPLSGCNGALYIGNGVNPTTFIMDKNLDLTCLGPIQFIVRNNANIDFSSGNFDLKLPDNSSIIVESGGNISASSSCSASDLIWIGTKKVASCQGSGNTITDFSTIVSDGGFNLIYATAFPSSICNTGSSIITATAIPSSGATYKWYDVASGGSTLPNGTSATYNTQTITTSKTYYVEASYDSGSYSTARKAVTVTVNPTSAVGAVSANQTICSGSFPSSNITIASATGTIQWQRADDSGFTTNLTNVGTNSTTLTIAQMGALTASKCFRAVVTSGVCSSSNSTTVTVTVNPLPTSPTTTNASICSGSSATLAASGVITGQTYKWYTIATGGSSINTTNSYNTPAITATTEYWVSIVNSNGCESERTKVTAFVNVNNIWNGFGG
jgi:hypothetical protein